MDQIFALQQIYEKLWEYAKQFNACFVGLENAYARIPKNQLWAVLLQYGIGGRLLTAIKSLHMHSKVCVRVNNATTKPLRIAQVWDYGKAALFHLFRSLVIIQTTAASAIAKTTTVSKNVISAA